MNRRKRITYRRADRALLALVDLIECDDFPREHLIALDRAADACRAMRDKATR